MKNHGGLKNMKTSPALFGVGLVYAPAGNFLAFVGLMADKYG
jgi:hypothetical protein